MKRIILSLAFAFISLFAQSPYDLKTLKTKENSLAKDYYIYRLFEENKISKQEAKTLRPHIFRYAGKLRKELEKFVPTRAFVDPKYVKCFNYTKSTILDANATCQIYRLNSLAFISSLSEQTRNTLAYNLKNHRDLSLLLRAFNQTNALNFLIENNNTTHFVKVYNHFNTPDISLNKDYVNELAKQKSFNNFSQKLIIKQNLPKLRSSFLLIDPQNTSEETAFHLGVNALTLNEEIKAVNFFQKAYESFKMQSKKDNALFWVYQISKDDKKLELLSKSSSLNIYSIYAKELKNVEIKEFTILKAKDKKNDFNMKDPFLWQSLAKKIQNAGTKELEKMAGEFNSQDTLPIYAYILERVDNFRKNYFIMPYFEYLKDYNIPRQALILAIARQESRFIPSAVSTSYALGMMQFMPYVATHIAQKELKIENFDPDEMFEPKTAYFFANHHLDYLEARLKNPVFIAYAYNGGIGFTNKMLKGSFFKPGKFEPFLSMELVPYQESRNYAKKVLANYIVYRHLLNDNIKISSIFESLIQSTEN
ncbi:lytic transglycosylase [Campylobacter sp. MIT 99-7217]|uniref:lytic transglycosylase domain-containing protein n=1 Tax=Campylobacter sp. MIT 99-7217 TaxID=535091 RepID=UPI0011595806|nr:lytic transglycosylase domain-containing protein [Campylobacter sp. MIT 99-7217]TQR34719.1 lytic transglycosylase [Campylobacter sp. MIT 99-7217]